MKSDPSKFKAPVIRFEEIRKKADDFRKKYWLTGKLPVDISAIIEFDLKLEIRPVSRLRELCDTDALLLGNFKTIIVDRDYYMDDRMENRLRFSLAHEIGHYILHRKIYIDFSYSSEAEWIELLQKLPEDEYRWLEWQAHEFAGRLLVPKDQLKKDFKKAIEYAKSNAIIFRYKGQKENAKEYIASYICKKYGVSGQVITRRLSKESLWESFLQSKLI